MALGFRRPRRSRRPEAGLDRGTAQSPDVAAETNPLSGGTPTPSSTRPRVTRQLRRSAAQQQGRADGINTLPTPAARAAGPGPVLCHPHRPHAVDAGRPQRGQEPGRPGLGPFAQVPLSEVFEATGYGTPSMAGRPMSSSSTPASTGSSSSAPPRLPRREGGDVGGDLAEKITAVPVTTMKDVVPVDVARPDAQPGGRGLVSGGGEHEFGEQWTTRLTL